MQSLTKNTNFKLKIDLNRRTLYEIANTQNGLIYLAYRLYRYTLLFTD